MNAFDVLIKFGIQIAFIKIALLILNQNIGIYFFKVKLYRGKLHSRKTILVKYIKSSSMKF